VRTGSAVTFHLVLLSTVSGTVPNTGRISERLAFPL